MPDKKNMLITVALIIVIIVSAAVYLYSVIPQDSDDTNESTNNNDVNETGEIIFSVLKDDIEYEFNTSQLSVIGLISGNGSYIKLGLLPDQVVINGPFNFTGISVLKLIENIDNMPENYTISFNATDGYLSTFTEKEVKGQVDNYNMDGNITGIGNTTMVIAFMQDGEYLDETDGPFRIVFIGDDIIIGSNLWARMITSMQINTIP